MKDKKIKSFSLIGPGRLGITLSYSLIKAGWDLVNVVTHSDLSMLNAEKHLKYGKISKSFTILNKTEEPIFISVPDGKIQEVAEHLSKLDIAFDERVFLHFSGAMTSDLLAALKARGSGTGSLHPLYSFPVTPRVIPEGILFTFEGDKRAEIVADQIIGKLKGVKYTIDKPNKMLYHCGAVIAGSSSLALAYLGSKLIQKALSVNNEDLRRELIILQRSVLDNLHQLSWKEALTGPIKRGDEKTIDGHIQALKNIDDRDALEVYKMLKKLAKELLSEK